APEQPAFQSSAANAPPPAPAPARAIAGSTFLDASSAFEGVIRSSEPLRLDGRVKGEIHCEHSVVIGESAHIDATIRADSMIIAGEVRGEAHAARKITLTATARMEGDLTTPAIVIEDGAQVVGRIQIGARSPTSELQPETKPTPDERSRDTRSTTPSVTPPPPTS